ncbi:MAG TPA: YtxH domain-containing protein [Gemmatimonadales bacterium]|nr:YtxH domain-containing protein [Gemmatimonadales bacterium]
MARHRQPREVVYVDRGEDSSVKWLFWGALLGAAVALMYAPRSGEETRRSLQRRLWKLRAMTEEKLDELTQQFGSSAREAMDALDNEDEDDEFEDFDEAPPGAGGRGALSAREEIERRLAEARARRRADAPEAEEPLA